ncbi:MULTISPECIES: acetyl-CoA carboxylase biotin carboxyl carrier protein [Vagococcus]|uniref:Biotin carboxyl carrier protein of acetyl-CoA carboxylase n=1 Tax=Vagococcus fluvialis bH819 TaxID=1255619 RepID=A0A1X6WR45_9ENTE|nr:MULTISPECIES: acetyl-CoA carboxylase biotin carboxyl carrier protein [Vagococcus]SLM86813.1 Biotin carboxyl carrier protein of acetyl-CoA carboxylase [Vagococcus fluvialis bH819]HCM88729.1 acetyl-CoA carboxylase biotin carboxyl carrier protein [Vagococcus sp.]
MSFTDIKELLELFEAGSVRELDLKQGDLSLYLSKNETSRQVQQMSPSQPIAVEVPTASENNPVVKPIIAEAQAQVVPAAEGEVVTSPIVGVIYTSSDPSAPKFVNVGDKVAVGDTLCIVEAMKIMNEIKSDVAGVVTEILIENEDVVEFGQALFRIA